MRFIIIGLCLLAVILLYSSLIKYLNIKNNLFLDYISSVIDYTFIAIAYSLIFKSEKQRRFIYLSLLIVIISTIIDIVFVVRYQNVSVYSNNIKSIIQIFLLIYFIVRSLRSERNLNLLEIPLFLIALIKIISSVTGIIIDILKPYMMSNRLIEELLLVYCISFVLNGILIILLSIPIWKSAHNQKYAYVQI